ncbi:hypothetical protein BsWGS_15842 [Bradybaena similaris]
MTPPYNDPPLYNDPHFIKTLPKRAKCFVSCTVSCSLTSKVPSNVLCSPLEGSTLALTSRTHTLHRSSFQTIDMLNMAKVFQFHIIMLSVFQFSPVFRSHREQARIGNHLTPQNGI